MGDGIGGTEKKIGATTTANECASVVKENEPSANGATWGDGGCYAEFGATGTNFNDEWQTCRFEGRYIMFKKKIWFRIHQHYLHLQNMIWH